MCWILLPRVTLTHLLPLGLCACEVLGQNRGGEGQVITCNQNFLLFIILKNYQRGLEPIYLLEFCICFIVKGSNWLEFLFYHDKLQPPFAQCLPAFGTQGVTPQRKGLLCQKGSDGTLSDPKNSLSTLVTWPSLALYPVVLLRIPNEKEHGSLKILQNYHMSK